MAHYVIKNEKTGLFLSNAEPPTSSASTWALALDDAYVWNTGDDRLVRYLIDASNAYQAGCGDYIVGLQVDLAVRRTD